MECVFYVQSHCGNLPGFSGYQINASYGMPVSMRLGL